MGQHIAKQGAQQVGADAAHAGRQGFAHAAEGAAAGALQGHEQLAARQDEQVLPAHADELLIPEKQGKQEAAGSESSGDTVISNEETGRKYGYGSPHLRPLISVMNPELFFTLPKNQVANGVADMMSHIFERYFTNTTNVDLTDALCEATLRTIISNAPRLLDNRKDYDAWAEIGFSGTVAHNGLLGMGREQDWACHNMEHELSAAYDVAHGAGLAVLTPAWMKYVYKDNIDMFAQFAIQVMGVAKGLRDKEALVLEGIARLQEFYRLMGLPQTLKELGIDESRLEEMAKKSTGAFYDREEKIGGLKKLGWEDVLKIYQLAK